jgi:hypothetical protein
MNRAALFSLFAAGALLLGGCATIGEIGSGNATTLQQAMAANHKTAISLLTQANVEALPYRIEAEAGADTFSKSGLNLLAPEDIAAWDKILSGLDSYCTALAQLTTGAQSTDYQTAAESLGSGIQSVAKAVSFSDPHGPEIETAVTELGTVLIRYKAESDAQKVAKAADPAFQTVVGDLLGVFGFEGHPPAASAHGLLATYEVEFEVGNAANAKAFKDGTIAGFSAMSPADKKANIQAFVAWQAAQQDHDAFVAAMKTLGTALAKAAAAHAAFAQGSKETAAEAFTQLKTEIQNVKAIEQKFPTG